jgi:hypothetical protein
VRREVEGLTLGVSLICYAEFVATSLSKKDLKIECKQMIYPDRHLANPMYRPSPQGERDKRVRFTIISLTN